MDPVVAKRNAQAEERLKNLALPELREETITALDTNLARTADRYDLIKDAAQRYGVDPDELYAKYVIETRGEVHPETPRVSSAGASGPFQLMPNTRKAFANPAIKDDFEREADAAARYMADMQKRNGFSPDALSVAYNLGEGKTRQFGGDATTTLPTETTNYLAYARYLRPKLRQQTMDAELAAAAASVPVPKFEKQSWPSYTMGEESPVAKATAEYDRQVQAARDAKKAELDQRYKETP